MRRRFLHTCLHACAWLAASASSQAIAETDTGLMPVDDLAALMLADDTADSHNDEKPWKLTVEAAAGMESERDTSAYAVARGALDMALDYRATPTLRLVFRDRIDDFSRANASGQHVINTWKEGYLAWQPTSHASLELGRINVRQGVAMGYNPTDWFNDGAVRAVPSVAPDSLRQNRQGSIVARSQWLWNGGAAFALYSPKLASTPSQASFSPDLGATNRRHRYLLGASARLSDRIQPQLLLQGGQGQSPQVGVNLSVLASDAVTAYAEWSGGRDRSQLNEALGLPPDTAFRQRLSTGGTWTIGGKVTATAEYQYDGAAPDATQWRQFWRLPPAAQMGYRQFLADSQELATRSGAFLYVSWRDAMTPGLDLNAMARLDLVDRSNMFWIEWRYRLPGWDIALQWQRNAGARDTSYGSLPVRQSLMLLTALYF
ncbi:hypothetical protein [Cupriavidus sp. DL-D2]|uniref:hypothetical protein n=1 Tax=Cupriavidus sp. DL-D2 TaxID=3144974 RepID=UPI00321515B3